MYAPNGVPSITNPFARAVVKLCDCWIVGVELIFMNHVGARIAPIGYVFLLVPLLGILTYLAGTLEPLRNGEMASFSLLMLVCLFQRRWESWHHLRFSSTDRHTYSPGQSFIDLLKPITPKFLDFLFDPWLQLRFFQPAAIAAFGLWIWMSGASKVVAVILIGGAIMSCLKQCLIYEAMVDQLLQHYDAQLAQYYAPSILSGKAKTPTERAGIPVSPVMMQVQPRITKPDMAGTVRRAMGMNEANEESLS
jgi:hypothetical protein